MSKVGMVAQDFKPSIWEADVGRSLSLRLAQSIYRASSRISRTTQRNPIWKPPHQYSELNWVFSKSTICS